MVYNLMANLVNVVLNYLLINGIMVSRLELAGASLARSLDRLWLLDWLCELS